MEIGVLADLLKSDATELAKSHKLADGTALEGETLVAVLKTEIENVRNGVRSEAKKEGHGWGRKEALTEVEKELASDLGLKSKDFKEMVTEIKSLVTGKSDDKTAMQLETTKEKLRLKEKEFEDFKLGIETTKKVETTNSIIKEKLKKEFDLSSTKLVNMAINDFHANYNVEVDGEEIQLYTKANKAVFTASDEVLKTHFGEILPKKAEDDDTGKVKIPKFGDKDKIVINGTGIEALTKELHAAKTPELRAAILKKIQDLSN